MWITRPDGSSPFYGDDDGGRLILLDRRRADDFRDTLATGAALFERCDWKFVAGEAAVETLWLLGPAGLANYEDLKAEPPSERARAFSAGGYFVMRDDWTKESGYALVKCGPHGVMNCGHAHADALSFEFAWGGVNWIVDPGTYTYTGDRRARHEFRASNTHNTVMVDGASQSIPNGPFAWDHIAVSSARSFNISHECISFVGCHNGYERFADPVSHERSVTLHKGDPLQGKPAHLSIRDALDTHDLHRYELRFQFSSGCRITTKGYQVRITASGGRELILMTCVSSGQAGVIQVPARIDQGWVSHGYAHREPAPVVVMEVEGRGPQTFTTIIVPVAEAERYDCLEDWLRGSLGRKLVVASDLIRRVKESGLDNPILIEPPRRQERQDEIAGRPGSSVRFRLIAP
jgi:hypothetical protein